MAQAKRPATAADMIRSLVIILVPLLLITWFFSSNLRDHPVQPVDWRPAYDQARAEAAYSVLAPADLPAEWIPTRVGWVREGGSASGGAPAAGDEWTIGYLSPDQIYFAVRQSDAAPAQTIADASRDARPDGTGQVGGQRWERFVSPDDRTRSLVLRGPDVTTVVTADAPYGAVEAFAAALRTDA